MTNNKKDLTKCLAKTKVSPEIKKDIFWRVYLWGDVESLCANTEEKLDPDLYACHCSMIYWESAEGEVYHTPCMGEIHFISDKWDEEIVSHECTHAAFQVQRTHLLNLEDFEDEEKICWVQGSLCKQIYQWLWSVDCPKIETEEQNERALKRIENLWGSEPGITKSDQLDALIKRVSTFEEKHYPI